jgi:hypothetical protein
MRRRALRAWVGRALHFLGRATYPRGPRVEARLEGRRCVIAFELQNTALRRSRRLYLTIHEDDRVIGSRIVRRAPVRGDEVVLLPHAPDRVTVWASTFNLMRQRSELTRVEASPIG